MKAVRHLLALVALALAATTASAQFVKGNEAVKVMPDGTKKDRNAPLPGTGPLAKHKALRCRRRVFRRALAHGRNQAGSWSAPRPTRDPAHADIDLRN
jgi:hypothetical protein